MNRFKFLLLLVSLTWIMCPSFLFAKDGKIKYGKYIIFMGNIENKKPSGQGELHLLDPQNKKQDYCVISGYFNDSIIVNAKISSNYSNCPFSSFELSGLSGRFILKFKGERKKCQSFEVVFENTSLSPKSTSKITTGSNSLAGIQIDNMTLSFQQIETGWTIEVTDYNKPKLFSLDDAIAQQITGLKNCFIGKYLSSDAKEEIRSQKLSQKGFPDCNDFDVYAYFQIEGRSIKAVPLKFYIAEDGTISYKNTFINPEKGYTYTLNNDDWDGCVVFNDGTIVKKTLGVPECEVKWQDGNTYNGTLRRTVSSLLDINTTISQSDFNTGEYTKDGTKERWINGESFNARHQRLSKLYDEATVLDIESGKISEADLQKRKAEEAKRKAEEAKREAIEKLEFSLLGIPIQGRVSDFVTRLKQEGCRQSAAKYKTNEILFSGTVLGYKSNIRVFYDDITKLVYKVRVETYDWENLVNNLNKKYAIAEDRFRSKKDDWSPVKVYSNGKYTLIARKIPEIGRARCFLTYYNEENFKKKAMSNFSIPSMNLSKDQFIAAYKNRGRIIWKEKGWSVHYLDINGRIGSLSIDCDDFGKIDEVRIEVSSEQPYEGDELASDFEESDKKTVDMIRKQLDYVYPTARRDFDRYGDSYYYYLDNMSIKVRKGFPGTGSVTVYFFRNKPKRSGSDI